MSKNTEKDRQIQITEIKSSKEEYALKLSKYLKNNKNKKIQKKYFNRFKQNFSFEIQNFDEIFDFNTGAIVFDDYEVILLKNKNKNHMLFSLFEVDVFKNKLKYSYNKRNKIALRGANNYYFNMCFIENYTSDEIIRINKMIIEFLNNSCKKISKEKINIYSKKEDLKCVLAILDIIRNVLTIELYYFIKIEETVSLVFLYNELESEHIITKIYKLLEKIYAFTYNILFSKMQVDVKASLINLIEETLKLELYIKDKKNIKLNLKTIRMWRETDYIIENIISIREALIEIKKENKKITSEPINLFGVNYGSIDLAILTKVIAEELKYKNVNSGILIINSSYDEIYNKNDVNLECKVKTKTDLKISTSKNIVIDDNIVSGKSFETAINIISKNINYPIAGIIIRPPQINRINQMFTKRNNSRVRIECFDTYIKGLKGEAFFSKLCDSNKNESLLDGLNVFDEVKHNVRCELYKNKLYHKESYVGKLENDLFSKT